MFKDSMIQRLGYLTQGEKQLHNNFVNENEIIRIFTVLEGYVSFWKLQWPEQDTKFI